MLSTIAAITLGLAAIVAGGYECYHVYQQRKKDREQRNKMDILELMDQIREFLAMGTSVDDVFSMMPVVLRESELNIHKHCKKQYPNEPCYCIVCCLDRQVTNDTIFTKQYEGMVH